MKDKEYHHKTLKCEWCKMTYPEFGYTYRTMRMYDYSSKAKDKIITHIICEDCYNHCRKHKSEERKD